MDTQQEQQKETASIFSKPSCTTGSKLLQENILTIPFFPDINTIDTIPFHSPVKSRPMTFCSLDTSETVALSQEWAFIVNFKSLIQDTNQGQKRHCSASAIFLTRFYSLSEDILTISIGSRQDQPIPQWFHKTTTSSASCQSTTYHQHSMSCADAGPNSSGTLGTPSFAKLLITVSIDMLLPEASRSPLSWRMSSTRFDPRAMTPPSSSGCAIK